MNEVLSRLVSERRASQHLRSDNGPEFASKAWLRWAVAESLDVALIEPGKPWQNGTAESFNSKFRDECLSMGWFWDRSEATVVIEQWREHYNSVRPHSSLGNMTPAACRRVAQTTTNGEATLKNWVIRRTPAGRNCIGNVFGMLWHRLDVSDMFNWLNMLKGNLRSLVKGKVSVLKRVNHMCEKQVANWLC